MRCFFLLLRKKKVVFKCQVYGWVPVPRAHICRCQWARSSYPKHEAHLFIHPHRDRPPMPPPSHYHRWIDEEARDAQIISPGSHSWLVLEPQHRRQAGYRVWLSSKYSYLKKLHKIRSQLWLRKSCTVMYS